MNFKAVLFDLDGTLLDTLRDVADATNQALLQMGFPTHPTEEYKMLVGEGREALAYKALPENKRDPSTVNRLISLINFEYDKRWSLHTRPYEGIPVLLDGLSLRNIKMAVLSNKAQKYVEITVARLLPYWRFEVIIGAQPSLPLKPDPYAALLIARKLSIVPSCFLYLGDSGIDMRTAVNAGMYPVGALWGFRTAEELISAGAWKLISTPPELLEIL